MANTTVESRKRLVRIISHPEVQLVTLQFLLGQGTWSADMFDEYPPIQLYDLRSIRRFFIAYLGVTHCLDGVSFVYSGSGTGVGLPKGEAGRMTTQRHILDLGHDEIMRRRALGIGGSLFIHEKMSSLGARYFFLPAVRFPIIAAPLVQTWSNSALPRCWLKTAIRYCLLGNGRVSSRVHGGTKVKSCDTC